MISFRLLLLVSLACWITGVFLLLFSTLVTAVEVTLKLWRRTFASWAERRLRNMGVIQEKTSPEQPEWNWKRLALLLAIPGLALVLHDILLSSLVLGMGAVLLAWSRFQQKQAERAQINEDAETVALQIRSLMSVDHSLLNALTRVQLPTGVMNRAIGQVASRLRMHQAPLQAAQALKGLPGTVTSRLSAIIAHNARLTDAVQDGLLLSLEQEAHRQKLLRAKTRQTLSLVRGTIRLLQAVVVSALGFVLASPAWRDFFLQDIPRQVLLVVMLAGIVFASLYFEVEVHQLTYGEV